MSCTKDDLPLGCGLRLEASDKNELLGMNKASLLELFARHRALVFRSPEITTDDFVAFSNRLGHTFSGYAGGTFVRKQLDENPEVLSVTSSGMQIAIPLHSELHYTTDPPEVLWFYCVTAPLVDGETTLCDGVGFVEALRESTVDLFRTKRVTYGRFIARDDWTVLFDAPDVETLQRSCDAQGLSLTVHDDESITTEFSCYALKRGRFSDALAFANNVITTATGIRAIAKVLPSVLENAPPGSLGRHKWSLRMEDGAKIPDDVVDEVWRVGEVRTYAHPWEEGDIMMIDNTSMLHGRRKIGCNVRKIGVRQSRLRLD